jgi:hypothetical protein
MAGHAHATTMTSTQNTQHPPSPPRWASPSSQSTNPATSTPAQSSRSPIQSPTAKRKAIASTPPSSPPPVGRIRHPKLLHQPRRHLPLHGRPQQHRHGRPLRTRSFSWIPTRRTDHLRLGDPPHLTRASTIYRRSTFHRFQHRAASKGLLPPHRKARPHFRSLSTLLRRPRSRPPPRNPKHVHAAGRTDRSADSLVWLQSLVHKGHRRPSSICPWGAGLAVRGVKGDGRRVCGAVSQVSEVRCESSVGCAACVGME